MQKTPSRADAQAHRALLLDAADQVFSEQGVHVALELVAARAGVSRATLYRNFPDRAALIGALLERAFGQLELQAEQLAGQSDGLFRLLGHLAEMVVVSAPVSDHWRAVNIGNPVLAKAKMRLHRMVNPLLTQAIAAGTCRADLTTRDFLLVSTMLGSCLRGRTPAERRSLARRALVLLLDGLRPAPVPQVPPA